MGDRNSSETAIGPKKISLFVKLNLCTKCCPNRWAANYVIGETII